MQPSLEGPRGDKEEGSEGKQKHLKRRVYHESKSGVGPYRSIELALYAPSWTGYRTGVVRSAHRSCKLSVRTEVGVNFESVKTDAFLEKFKEKGTVRMAPFTGSL